ncbi:MAG TPA: nitrile hydratase accessory protein [Ramlibacter sp.]|nr:nitrile hydratase accessory protein [Ramlibacter sp.]
MTALPLLAGMPHDGDEPVFREPWEAQAFAMAVSLHQRGLFSWTEWAQALATQIAQAGEADTGGRYYHHWLAALESLVASKGASSMEEQARYRHAWEHAAERTPHGRPIELAPRDFG